MSSCSKSIFSLLLFLLLVTTPSYGEAENVLEYYQERGVVIAMSPVWSPYSFQDEMGVARGFLVDYWRKWSSEMQIPVSFVFAGWDKTIQMIRDGQADIHSGLYQTASRQTFLDFAKPIKESKGVFVVHDGMDCTSASKGEVGVVAGSFEQEALVEAFPESRAILFDTMKEVIDAFAQYKLSAIVVDEPILVVLDHEPGTVNYTVCQSLYQRPLFAAVNKGNGSLLKLVREGQRRIGPTLRKLIESRWFISEYDENSLLIKMVLLIAGALVLIAIVLFWLTRRPSK